MQALEFPTTSAPIPLTYKGSRIGIPGADNSLMTNTKKMPGLSWSIPAVKACPAAVFGEGTICELCYARHGAYGWASTIAAQEARFKWTVRSMRTAGGRAHWVAYLTKAIGRGRNPFFRVHDAGDLFNIWYVRCWAEVARNLPDKMFWIPTRMWQPAFFKGAYKDALLELAALPNVAVRPSALRFDDPPPVIPGLAAGTTAHKRQPAVAEICPARSQGGACGPCRACWGKTEERSYPAH